MRVSFEIRTFTVERGLYIEHVEHFTVLEQSDYEKQLDYLKTLDVPQLKSISIVREPDR